MPVYNLIAISTALATFLIADSIRKAVEGKSYVKREGSLSSRMFERACFATTVGALWFMLIPFFLVRLSRSR